MPYTTTSLAALQTLIAQRVDQSVYWTAEEARRALNEALRDWNLLTSRWRRTVALATVPGGVEVALGATLTYGMRVVEGTTHQPLHPTSILELDLMRPAWRRETIGTGGSVPTALTLWAPQSLQRIVLWPAPTVVGTVTVDGVSATPILVEAGDLVDLGDEIVPILVDYTLHLLAFKESGPRWRATLPAFQAFLRAAAVENGLLKANQAFRRAAGLDRRRDLQPTTVPTQLDQIAAQGLGATE